MKKRIILFSIILILKVGLTIAQTNAIEAKAAYLLAEESYGKGDYKAAINYLSVAKKNLGMANSKILYLQIQVDNELYKSKERPVDSLIKTIQAFQAAPDIKDFNEEKILEVVKLKMQLAQDEVREKELDKTFVMLLTDKWEVGSKLAELKQLYPTFFLDALMVKSGNYDIYTYNKNQPALALAFNKDVLYSRTTLYSFKGSSAAAAAKEKFSALKEDITKKLGALPTETAENGITSLIWYHKTLYARLAPGVTSTNEEKVISFSVIDTAFK